MKSTVNFTCTSSISSDVTFSWTHNGTSISGSSTTGNTSVLTITSVRNSDAGSYVCIMSSGSLSVMSNAATLIVYGTYRCMLSFYGSNVPSLIRSSSGHRSPINNVPLGRSLTLMCTASCLGTLVYSWERSSGGSWTIVSNDNTTSYTTNTTLAFGQYMYRCRVSNEAESVVSNNAIVNVYGEYCPNM